MRKVLNTVLLIALVAGLSGCVIVRAPVMPPMGLMYQNTRAPLDVDYDSSKLGKKGSASTECVLGLFSWGDASTEAAAQNGGVTTINHADYDFFNVLSVYAKYTTTVYGN